jgi:hypothetical protein
VGEEGGLSGVSGEGITQYIWSPAIGLLTDLVISDLPAGCRQHVGIKKREVMAHFAL